MENILEFIKPELFILIIFLNCTGLFLKLWTGFHKDWMIPYILLIISFLITLAYVCVFQGEGFTGPVIVAVVIESVLIASVSVFGNEMIKQITVKRKTD